MNEKNEPLVSVITPAFNAEKTILQAYHSLVNQTYNKWEWIVTDDGSSDRTFELLEMIAFRDSRVMVLKTDKNSGAASARNKGIEKAKGKYISFLDADDIWKSNKLKCQVNYMMDNGAVFTCSNYEVRRKDKDPILFRPKKDQITYKDLLKSSNIGCLTAMYDSEILGKIYMPSDAIKREDHAAWLDILRKGYVANRIDECLATYFINEKSVSSKKIAMFKYQYLMFRRHEKFNLFKSFYYTLIISWNKLFRKYH